MEIYTKSPLNYVGGKYKILDQILPKFPSDIHKFVDLFGGGYNVGINVKAQEHMYNDVCTPVSNLIRYIYENTTDSLLKEIDSIVNKYELSITNKEGFDKLRQDYNQSDKSDNIMFYTLVIHSFNNQIRFNRKNEFNMPFGTNRSYFSPTLREKFIQFSDKIKAQNLKVYSAPFNCLNLSTLGDKPFVYMDPPYLNSDATYNEKGGWTVSDEQLLLAFIDEMDKRGIQFALSNNLKYANDMLDKWKDKYKVHYLDADYSNCNHQKYYSGEDVEVLITNY